MAKKKASDKADKGADKGGDAPPAEPSYAELAAASDAVVVTVAKVIPRAEPPKRERPDVLPDLVMTTEVIWGPLPKDPPPKPTRAAANLKTEVMSPVRDRPKKVPSIGSMTPHLGKK